MMQRSFADLEAVPGADERLDPASERILESAREGLVEHGLRRTSLDDIAKVAGVSRATLFRRFQSRDALLSALLAREAHRLIARVDEGIAHLDRPEDRVVAGFLAFIREIRNHDLLSRLLITDPEQVLPLVTTNGEPALAIGRAYAIAALERARDEGAELTARPELLAELFVRIAHSLVLTPQTVLPLDDEDALAEFARTTLARLALRDLHD